MVISTDKLYKYKSPEYGDEGLVIKVKEIENELQILIETIKHPEIEKGYCQLLSRSSIVEYFVQLPDDHPLSVLYGG